jgi:hypothetical protein
MEWVYLYIISQMKTDEVLSQKEIDIIFLKIIEFLLVNFD